jgi:peptidyl-dipeptidase A
MADPSRIADEVEARLAPLAVESNLGWWNSQVEATEENAERRTRAELAWSDALADRALFASVEAARRTGAGDQTRRRLDLLHNAMVRRQVPDGLRSRIVELETYVDLRFSRHRGLVGGDEVGDTEIKRILRRSDDLGERREAWEASKTVGAEVADDVRELARLRNEAARSLGHRDWFALSLSTDELDETRLAATLAECDRVTAEPPSSTSKSPAVKSCTNRPFRSRTTAATRTRLTPALNVIAGGAWSAS